MTSPISKTRQAVEAFYRGDVKVALKIASGFRIGVSPVERSVLKRGFECMHSPDFYAQLGKDPEECQREAVALFRSKFCST